MQPSVQAGWCDFIYTVSVEQSLRALGENLREFMGVDIQL